jgi:hypothetical protein
MYTENITHFGDLHIDLENDIKMDLKEIGYEAVYRKCPMAGSRVYGNEPLGYRRDRDFVNQLIDS